MQHWEEVSRRKPGLSSSSTIKLENQRTDAIAELTARQLR